MWKKYSGIKTFKRIKVIHLEIRKYPGLFSDVEIDFESLTIKILRDVWMI